MTHFEYATLEWIWDNQTLRVNLPQNKERQAQGSYAQVVNLLTELGNEGWEVSTCAAQGNWLFWTLKREVE